MLHVIICIVLVLAAYLLQTSLFPFLALAGIVPNLLIIVTVSVALIQGRTYGCTVGFFCGLLMDISIGNYLGVNALVFLTLGYILGYFRRVYYEEDLTLPLLLVGAADLIYGLVTYVINFLIRGRFHFLFYLRRIILPELVYTLIAAIIFYKLILFLFRKRSKKESEELIV